VATKNKGLGTGLGALFGDDISTDKSLDGATLLPISKIEPRKEQPRNEFDESALQELADSIERYGVIQPITVRKLESGYYQIIAGERRWRASRLAGLNEVPVRVIEADDKKTAELALVENLQREDLNPIEEAAGYQMLIDTFGLTQEETAQSVGKSRSAVANMLRLLDLPDEILTLIKDGKITAGHARALMSVPNKELQIKLANEIIQGGLSVRKAEQLAAKLSRIPRAAKPQEVELVDYSAEVSNELTRVLSRKCKLVDGKRVGRIEIEFYNPDDREALINNLKTMGMNWQ